MSTNIQAKANLIWEVATKLVGVYKPHEYGKVILPMTVLKRFDDILKPTKEAVLKKYEEVKNFEVKEILKSEIKYGYRFTNLNDYIILSVTFILEKGDPIKALKDMKENNEKRLNSQPLNEKCVGSIFKNPENASSGKLIDSLNLKGYHINDAKISEKHANFIVNEGNASFEDVIELIKFIKIKVFENYGISLETEPIIVRWSLL